MKNLNDMNKEELDEYDNILNHPANEWLVFFWVMGVLDLPPELKSKWSFLVFLRFFVQITKFW